MMNSGVEWLAILFQIRENRNSVSARRSAILTKDFHGFPPSTFLDDVLNQATTASLQMLSKSYLLTILSFDAIRSEVLREPLNKPLINK
jgi:hypothetical protein